MKLYNFRDLGGLPTKCDRQIKTGLLYRTGNVAHWSNEAAAHVAKEYGVKLYIDLRTSDEVKTFGRPEALIRQKVEWLSLSIDTSDKTFEKLTLPKAQDWLELYQRLFAKNLEVWSQFAKIISEANEPILYGCLFGKDRTGIATSLILNILEVHDEHIAADYAKTTHEVQPLADLFRHLLSHHREGSEQEIFEHFSRSHESVMLGFLEYMRTHPEDHKVGKVLRELIAQYREPMKKRLLR